MRNKLVWNDMSYNFLALSIGIFFLILAIFSSPSTIAEMNARTWRKQLRHFILALLPQALLASGCCAQIN